jgi:predicted PolB exonuclease-like 3'-5' exonuclease
VGDILAIDLETLPTENPQVIADIAAGITAPGNISKAETVAAWEAEKKPALVAEAVAKTSFNGAHGSIACIAWAWNDDEPQVLDTRSFNEFTVLSEFSRLISAKKAFAPKIVGHYVAEFDLRFLWQRAFILGVRMPAFWPRDVKSWSKEVADTMFMFCGAKGTISLDNLCKALGIEGKSGFDGSMVAEAWKNGEFDKVTEYCMSDIRMVRAAYKKMLVAYGED